MDKIAEQGLLISTVGTAAYYGLNWMLTYAAQVFEVLAMMVRVPH